MKIKSLQLQNFKRFTNLTLQDIPENAKLVLLIGANGSGKSSVFDAFEVVSSETGKVGGSTNYILEKKATEQFGISIETHDYGKEEIITNRGWKRSTHLHAGSFYGRTSFRQIPRLTRNRLGDHHFNITLDNNRPPTFIDRDERFENDLEHLFGKLLKEFFRTSTDKSEIKDKVINPVNEALERIFGQQNGTKLKLLELIPPLEGKVAEVNFQKGTSVFHYNYLSAGEKEVFNILINLVARKEYYTDTVFFFDEIDLHLNTRLQYNFLKEIVENWIPDNCQFWTASHSLGFIQYAKDTENAVIFDFDDYDFDFPKVLSPAPKDNPDIYEIAVDKDILPFIFKDYIIIFVENKDRYCYSALNIPKTLFVQENGKQGVYHKVKNGDFSGIIDRDFLTDSDIEEIEKQYSKLKILRFYSIENYLYHPENLLEYFSSKNMAYDKGEYIQKLTLEKNKIKSELVTELTQPSAMMLG